jgi:hypothetical protein
MKIGKIYKIIHTQSNICYVGSTFDELRNRFRKHKNDLNCSISKYFTKFGIENFKIILIKEYEVIDRKCLQAFEQLWINKLKSINMKQTFKPLKKQFENLRLFQIDRSDYHKKYFCMYKNDNKENYIKNKDQENFNCECGGKYTFQHKKRHLKSEKHLSFINKTVKLEKKATDKIKCICGSIYSRTNKNKHIKTIKHLEFIENQ